MANLPTTNLTLSQTYTFSSGGGSNFPISMSSLYNTGTGIPVSSSSSNLSLGLFGGKSSSSIYTNTGSSPVLAHAPSFNTYTTIDGAGNIWVTGVYSSSTTLTVRNLNGSNTSPAISLPSTSSKTLCFVVMYNASGTCQFANCISLGFTTSTPTSISTDSQNNMHIVGTYVTGAGVSVTLSNLTDSASTVVLPPSTVTSASYIVYSSTGNCLRGANIITPTSTVSPTSIYVANDNIWVCGTFTSSTSIIPKNLDGNNNTAGVTIAASTGSDVFLLKYSSVGNCIAGSRIMNGAASDAGNMVKVDSVGNIYVVGNLSTTSQTPARNLDGTSSSFTVASSGIDALFITYNSSGNCTGAASIGGSLADQGLVLSIREVAGSTVMFMGGSYASTSTTIKNLNGTTAAGFSLPSPTTTSGFIITYSSDGMVSACCQVLPLTTNNIVHRVLATPKHTYVFGYYEATLQVNVRNLDGTDSTVSLPQSNAGASKYNAYIIKYDINGAAMCATNLVPSTGNSRPVDAVVVGGRLIVVGLYNHSTGTVSMKDLNGSTIGTLSATSTNSYIFNASLIA